MSGSDPSHTALDPKRRRARFRSWHRGMREMDILLGKFADAQIAELNDAELDDFEALMELPDRDVFMWLSGEDETPPGYDTPVFRKLKQFHSHDRPINL
jgi:antitoxin CptB